MHRPDVVRDRKQLGHWECDLIQFRKKFGKANVTSLVERVSRFTVFLRNNDRQSRAIMDGLIDVLGPLPHSARRSITFDRGTEFTDWPYLQAGLGVQTWFCDSQAPWQKGTVENTNRRARKWLPCPRCRSRFSENSQFSLTCSTFGGKSEEHSVSYAALPISRALIVNSPARNHPSACLFCRLAQPLVSCPQLGSAVD